jgi:hypothetical protein
MAGGGEIDELIGGITSWILKRTRLPFVAWDTHLIMQVRYIKIQVK